MEYQFFRENKNQTVSTLNVKTVSIVFFDMNGIMRYECVLRGQTVNRILHKEV